MIRAIIIDDEAPCVDGLFFDLQKYCPQVEVIAKCYGSKEGLVAIKNLKPDLIFLDIEMPWMNGFELIDMIDNIDFDIVFTTAYDQFAVRAFKVSALDYLLKPIDHQDLIAAVKKITQKVDKGINLDQLKVLLHNTRQSIGLHKVALPTKEGLNFVDLQDILYAEADGNYTTIYFTEGKKTLLSKSLKEVQKLLDGYNFCRIHNSTVINIDQIDKYIRGDGGYVVMSNGQSLNVSRAKKEELLQKIKTH